MENIIKRLDDVVDWVAFIFIGLLLSCRNVVITNVHRDSFKSLLDELKKEVKKRLDKLKT